MEYTRAQYVDYYVNRIVSGDMDFSAMAKELNDLPMDEKEQRIIGALVNNAVRNEAAKSARRKRGKQMIYGGSALALLGIMAVVYPIMTHSGQQSFYVTLSPLAIGLSFVIAGIHESKTR